MLNRIAAASLGAIFALTSHAAMADDNEWAPSCTDSQGLEVEYVPVNEAFLKERRTAFASVGYREHDPISDPVIFFDAYAFSVIVNHSDLGSEIAIFLLTHECAHLSTGDFLEGLKAFLNNGIGLPPKIIAEKELNADCHAAARVRDEYGFESSDLRPLFAFIKETTSSSEFAEARIANIQACFADFKPS